MIAVPKIIEVEARAKLAEIESTFSLAGAKLNATSIDPRRHMLTFPSGKRVGFSSHLNKRRKALRDWLREWGEPLKELGYSVVVHEDFPKVPIFTIVKNVPDDDEIAQLENEKSKKIFDPNRQRSKRLGKRLEE